MKFALKGNTFGSQCRTSLRDLFTWVKLAHRRLRSEEDYRAFQAYQALLVIEYLKKWRVWREGQLVLDLGSGIGGYSQQMVEHGARVLSLDMVIAGPRFGTMHSPIVANALYIPIRDETVDLVFCASLIEHISDPLKLLNEIQRVMKTGGYCYISFPPFYSPRGGHEFSPFHYLGERCALRLSCLLRRRHPEWIVNLYKERAILQIRDDKYSTYGLYRRTIAQVRRMIINCTAMTIVDMSPRYVSVNTAQWPVIGELLTWHVQFLLRKTYRSPTTEHIADPSNCELNSVMAVQVKGKPVLCENKRCSS